MKFAFTSFFYFCLQCVITPSAAHHLTTVRALWIQLTDTALCSLIDETRKLIFVLVSYYDFNNIYFNVWRSTMENLTKRANGPILMTIIGWSFQENQLICGWYFRVLPFYLETSTSCCFHASGSIIFFLQMIPLIMKYRKSKYI